MAEGALHSFPRGHEPRGFGGALAGNTSFGHHPNRAAPHDIVSSIGGINSSSSSSLLLCACCNRLEPASTNQPNKTLSRRACCGFRFFFCRDVDDDVTQVQKAAMNCLAVLLQSSAQALTAAAAKIDLASNTFELEIAGSAVPETEIVSSDAIASGVLSPMEIGDVPEFVGSVAVGGVLPERFRGGDEGSWLEKALKDAFRQDGGQESGEGVGADGGRHGGGGGSGSGSDGGRVPALPAQVRACIYHSAFCAG